MIISISGPGGSGKSTIAKILAEKLGWPRYYIGGMRREAAQKRGMTLAEYNKLGETDPSTDLEVDKYQEELGRREDNFVIEGRTSWYFIPHSLKIYVDVDQKIGAERIFSDLQKNGSRNEDVELRSVEEVLESMKKRHASDVVRYEKYFGIDVFNPNNYDFVVDTSNLTKEESFSKVYEFVKKKLQEK